MAPPRGRAAAGLGRSAIGKAVVVGVVTGLLISAAVFLHQTRIHKVQAELSNELTYQVEELTEERHKRELAEQLQEEADTERGKLQDSMKELSAQLIEAQVAAREAEAARKTAKDAETLAAAEAKRASAELLSMTEAWTDAQKEAKAAQQNLERLGSQAGKGNATGDRHAPWQPSAERDTSNPELAALLRQVAVNNEVMVAISNRNYAGKGNMLETWMQNVERAGVHNAMVLALDADTKAHAESEGLAAYEMHVEVSASQKNVGENHAVSGLKFKILQQFLILGYSVLLSDVDIVTLQNPFDHLYRDSDVEGMSDGWTNQTAYGYNDVDDDPSMGWARYAHSMRVFCMNSGLFYIRPTKASMDLLAKVVHRLETEAGWDQAIFNEVIFFPSHNEHTDPAVTRRIMDYMAFMNSKVLFKHVRHKPRYKDLLPVTVHVNYHSTKHQRMKAIVRRYVDGDHSALDAFPDGS